MEISAFIPCFNNVTTLPEVVTAIMAQTVPTQKLFVVDDASSDGSVVVAEAVGASVIRHPFNLGRGAVRARAITDIPSELILACDAAVVPPPNFIEQALPYFDEPDVAAVFGRVVQSDASSAADRWRGRHLFKTDHSATLNSQASLATGAVLLRRSAVLAVGNFNALLRAGEDAELGQRLLNAHWKVVCDPALTVQWLGTQTVKELLERYGRWNRQQAAGWRDYLRQVSYSLKVMAREDLRRHDPVSALISLICPHYIFWRKIHG